MLPRLVDSMRSGVAHDFEDCIKDTIVFVWACASRSFDFVLARTIDVGSGSRVQAVLLAVFRVRVGVKRICSIGLVLIFLEQCSYDTNVRIPRDVLMIVNDKIS